MRIYVVIGQTELHVLADLLGAQYPNATHEVREGVWLLRAPEQTTKEVSDKLGMTPPKIDRPAGVVVGVNGYFGASRPDLWEWFKNAEQASNG